VSFLGTATAVWMIIWAMFVVAAEGAALTIISLSITVIHFALGAFVVLAAWGAASALHLATLVWIFIRVAIVPGAILLVAPGMVAYLNRGVARPQKGVDQAAASAAPAPCGMASSLGLELSALRARFAGGARVPGLRRRLWQRVLLWRRRCRGRLERRHARCVAAAKMLVQGSRLPAGADPFDPLLGGGGSKDDIAALRWEMESIMKELEKLGGGSSAADKAAKKRVRKRKPKGKPGEAPSQGSGATGEAL
jgi:hypothetical protein